MAIFGSPTGRVYCLGRINVVTPGTAVKLNQNVPFVTGFGAAGNAPTMRSNQIIFDTPSGGSGSSGQNASNAGAIYICAAGGNRTIQNSIIKTLQPGASWTFGSSGDSSWFDPSFFVVDADNSNDGVRVTTLQST